MVDTREHAPYQRLACTDDCHPDRYEARAIRTWWGAKRWTVIDQHMGIRLSRICTTEVDVELWLGSLRAMEVSKRWSQYIRSQGSS